MELLLLPDRIDAAKALTLGLVNGVVPRAELEAETLLMAEQLAANSIVANASTKRLLRQSIEHGLVEQLDMERRYLVSGSVERDFAEGVSAFIEKRRPRFAMRSTETDAARYS